jgi:hypothetical protein
LTREWEYGVLMNDTDRGKAFRENEFIIFIYISLSRCYFVHQKSHMDWPTIKPRSLLWDNSNQLHDPWYSLIETPIKASTRTETVNSEWVSSSRWVLPYV